MTIYSFTKTLFIASVTMILISTTSFVHAEQNQKCGHTIQHCCPNDSGQYAWGDTTCRDNTSNSRPDCVISTGCTPAY